LPDGRSISVPCISDRVCHNVVCDHGCGMRCADGGGVRTGGVRWGLSRLGEFPGVALLSASADSGPPCPLLQDGGELGQHVIYDRRRHAFQPSAVAGTDVEGAGLVAPRNPGCFGARPRQRNGESSRAGEIAAGCGSAAPRGFRQSIERTRRHDQYRSRSPLLMAG